MIGNQVADEVCRDNVPRFTAIEAVGGLLGCVVGCDIEWGVPLSGSIRAAFALGARGEGAPNPHVFRASPQFRTLVELDRFCLRHLDEYAKIAQQTELHGALPERWFWQTF